MVHGNKDVEKKLGPQSQLQSGRIFPVESEIARSRKKDWAKAHSRKQANFGDISAASDQSYHLDFKNCGHDIGEQIECLVSWSENRYGHIMFVKAKEEFYQACGKFFYDEPNYHARVSYFIDHFLFERAISDHIQQTFEEPPFFEFLKSELFLNTPISDTLRNSFLNLKDTQHSLFVVKKIRKDQIIVEDILKNKLISVSPIENQRFDGLCKGQVFQSFIYSWNETHVLSKGIILHPVQSWKVILKMAKNLKKEGGFQVNEVFMKLAKLEINSKTRRVESIKSCYQTALL